jgi:hypothetical protein
VFVIANQLFLIDFANTVYVCLGAKRDNLWCYSKPPRSDTVGLPRFCDALRSSLVIVQRTPSVVLQAAFAAAGSLLLSPSHVAQSAESRPEIFLIGRDGKGINSWRGYFKAGELDSAITALLH